MKIDRRSFLSFVIGGAAGTALSPLPLKLMDDSSIWSQMWPWTPVPQDGEATYVNSACTLCPGGCGITVRKIGKRAVKIEGMKGHPVNNGGICVLGLSGLQLLYGPMRVKTPLKRVGERGQDRWERISWDAAVAEVVQKLDELKSKGESHTVGCISGPDRGTVPLLFERFLAAYGSPNLMRTASFEDAYALTFRFMQGVQAFPGFDFENADFIVSFGSGILDGWGSPVRMFRVSSHLHETGGEIVQIEPRLSNTAAKAHQWVPIKPGTEADLALGLAHVILKNSLYKTDFVYTHTTGFDDWRWQVLDKYAPDQVAATTGIDKETIMILAKRFAGASKPLAICGQGRGATPGSLKVYLAVHALNALVGNINKAGGVWPVPEPDYLSGLKLEPPAAMPAERIDGAGTPAYPFSQSLLNRLPAAVISGKPYPMNALLVTGENPLYTMDDSKTVREAFAKIPFIVSFSSYMDETAQFSDLILPNHMYLERYQDVPSPAGLQKPIVGFSKPVVEPQFNTKHAGDAIILIAKGLGGDTAEAFPWDNYEACLEEALGDKWDTLLEEGFWTDTEFQAPGWGEAFTTASGKFEFVNSGMGSGAQFGPVKIEGEEEKYPLVLIPYDSMRLASGFIGDPPFVVKTVEDTVLKGNDVFVEVNPETAKKYGLREGRPATLDSPKGSAKVLVHLSDGIMPGYVAMPRGLGHTAYDKFLAGKGKNFNEFIGPVEDPLSGLDAAWGIRVKLG
ncbi:MAG: menaquinone reductase molybdopterin-binding-like subunit QrcB [Pseudomonadota bacterium]